MSFRRLAVAACSAVMLYAFMHPHEEEYLSRLPIIRRRYRDKDNADTSYKI